MRILTFFLVALALVACATYVQGQHIKTPGQQVHVHVRHAKDIEDQHSRHVIHRIVNRVGKEHRAMLHKLEHVLASLKSGGKARFDTAAELALDQKEEAAEKKALVKAEIKNKLKAAIRSGNKTAIKKLWGSIFKKASPATLKKLLGNAMIHARTAEERAALKRAMEKAQEKEINQRESQARKSEAVRKANTNKAQQEIEKLLEKMKKPEAPNGGIVMHGKKCKKTQRNSWPVELDEYGGKMTQSQLAEVRSMHDRVNGLLETNPNLSIVEKTLRGASGTIKHAHDQHVWLRQDALPAWDEESLVPAEIQDAMSGRWQDAINISPF